MEINILERPHSLEHLVQKWLIDDSNCYKYLPVITRSLRHWEPNNELSTDIPASDDK